MLTHNGVSAAEREACLTCRSAIIATAGHVDHGKSALVRALTGLEPDRLPAEKARGLTVELGFTHFFLTEAAAAGPCPEIGIVDVPGHEDFVRNMIAGVGAVDAALLVVAADEGWMPQTEEHLQILEYLAVPSLLFVLTKCDLVEDPETVGQEVGRQLESSRYATAPVLPVSALTGAGIAELRQALADCLLARPRQSVSGKPRLPVDRVFTLKGLGTVVTGTPIGGEFAPGETVLIQPSQKLARIRSIQSYGRECSRGGPGTRLALNLVDLAVEHLRRGDVVTRPGFGEPAETLEVELKRSARRNRSNPSSVPLANGMPVLFHHGSAQVAGRLVLLDKTPVEPGATTLGQVRLGAPIFAFAGDRFILRDAANRFTVAGGIILDPSARRRHFRNERHRSFLTRAANNLADPAELIQATLARDHVSRRADLLVRSQFSLSQISAALEELRHADAICLLTDYVVERQWWRAVLCRAVEEVDRQHTAAPETPGLPLTKLRSRLPGEFRQPTLCEALLKDLASQGYEVSENCLRARSHMPSMPDRLRDACARLQTAFLENSVQPPSLTELPTGPAAREALRFLRTRGDLIELSSGVYLSRIGFSRIRTAIVQYLQQKPSATVSELRQASGSTRRIMVPLLEKLDREGLTVRSGDRRSLRSGGQV